MSDASATPAPQYANGQGGAIVRQSLNMLLLALIWQALIAVYVYYFGPRFPGLNIGDTHGFYTSALQAACLWLLWTGFGRARIPALILAVSCLTQMMAYPIGIFRVRELQLLVIALIQTVAVARLYQRDAGAWFAAMKSHAKLDAFVLAFGLVFCCAWLLGEIYRALVGAELFFTNGTAIMIPLYFRVVSLIYAPPALLLGAPHFRLQPSILPQDWLADAATYTFYALVAFILGFWIRRLQARR
jgi:hypothetical protein